jgi:hypothetical protein
VEERPYSSSTLFQEAFEQSKVVSVRGIIVDGIVVALLVVVARERGCDAALIRECFYYAQKKAVSNGISFQPI